jgi:RNA polymerase sigma-70 factor, ECF subfamily
MTEQILKPETVELARTSSRPSLNSLRDLPDPELVERAQRGEILAFEALLRRYNRRLFRISRSILRDDDAAEDAVQEAYIQAFSQLHRYEPTGKFGAWLGRVALNRALMLRRSAGSDTVSFEELDDASLSACEASCSEASLSSRYVEGLQARQLLESAIDSLPDSFRVVFMLRRVEQLSVNETADLLSLNECTVRTRLNRAERMLRLHLSRQLSREQLSVFDFDGERCDRIVARVLSRMGFTAPLE